MTTTPPPPPPAEPHQPPFHGQPSRPGVVVAAFVILIVLLGLAVFAVILSFSQIASVSGYVDTTSFIGVASFSLLLIAAELAFAILTFQGRNWARITLTVILGVNAISSLAQVAQAGGGGTLFGIALIALVLALLWAPVSNAYFAAIKRARRN